MGSEGGGGVGGAQGARIWGVGGRGKIVSNRSVFPTELVEQVTSYDAESPTVVAEDIRSINRLFSNMTYFQHENNVFKTQTKEKICFLYN